MTQPVSQEPCCSTFQRRRFFILPSRNKAEGEVVWLCRAHRSPPCRRTPGALPHLDSCLFSPTLSTDLIEGNHSDKKPPTMMPLHSGLCALPPSNPTTSPPLQLSPPPLKCHAILSTHPEPPLTLFPSHRLQRWRRHNEPFVWQREEVTVTVFGG